ncbi:MAG: hypothetical protein AAF367_07970 [Pseudomonadota bacterium]
MKVYLALTFGCVAMFAADRGHAARCDQEEAVVATPMLGCIEQKASEIERLMNNILDAGHLIGKHLCTWQKEALAQAIADCRSINLLDAMNEATTYATDVAVEKVYLYRVARGAL